jgi:2-polyprenyl-3-methyl-5-hydroxy-6-metoxy-1,4-benzoquinol methylase
VSETVKNNLLQEIFAKKNWRHRMKLDDKAYTPGYCDESEWEIALLPKSLEGKSFLDVASNDGMYSILADKKGATNVLGVDIYNQSNDLNMTNSWDFEKPMLLKKYFNSKASFESRSVYELSELKTQFDYVFSSNLISWLTDPYTALLNISSVCKEVLHLREDISEKGKSPALEYIHKGDGTCYFNPNKAFIKKVLQQQGFKKIEFYLVDERNLLKDRIARQRLITVNKGTPIFEEPFSNQLIGSIQNDKLLLSYFNQGDYSFIEKTGWIKNSNITSEQPLLLGRTYPYLTSVNKILKNSLKLERNYIIKAYR